MTFFNDAPMWVVRAGRRGAFAEDFLSGGFVGIGFNEMPWLEEGASDEEIAAAVAEGLRDKKVGSRRAAAGQLKRFLRELRVGDAVATYEPSQRIFVLGTIRSTFQRRADHSLARTRLVDWTHKVSRDRLSVGARNSLGAIMTLFRLNEEVSAELARMAVPLDADLSSVAQTSAIEAEESEETSEAILREEVVEKSESFIEDRIARLDWSELQSLVAGLLRAMGYRTRVAEPGPDRGVDVFASPDGLGLQEPRIFVEVKHRPATTMGSQEIRSFLGGRQPGDRCLYVSTGGFSKDARYEAERSSIPLMLVTLPELRDLLIEHYENLDSDARALVPLSRLYWPVD